MIYTCALTSSGDFGAFFTTGTSSSSSSSESSRSVLASFGDFGAYLGNVCILFSSSSSSESSKSESSSSESTNSWDFGAFWGCLCVHFPTKLSVTVPSCMLPTKGSSIDLAGFSASSLICLALLLYANSLAGYSLISFHLLDTIL